MLISFLHDILTPQFKKIQIITSFQVNCKLQILSFVLFEFSIWLNLQTLPLWCPQNQTCIMLQTILSNLLLYKAQSFHQPVQAYQSKTCCSYTKQSMQNQSCYASSKHCHNLLPKPAMLSKPALYQSSYLHQISI